MNSDKIICTNGNESDSDDSVKNTSYNGLEDNSPLMQDKRTSRNQNEKNRRDQFNSLIHELGSLIDSKRKIDKASVLNEAINYFHNCNVKMPKDKEICPRFKPMFLKNHELMKLMFDFQFAFCLVFDLNGDIKYASIEIEKLLGYDPKTLNNQSIFNYVDEKSSKQIKQFLRGSQFLREKKKQDCIEFDCKFKRNDGSGECVPFTITGVFKATFNSAIESIGHFNTIARLNKNTLSSQTFLNCILKCEFDAELTLDLKFTKLDSKATKMIGYSPMEIFGTSIYDYCHPADIQKLVACHQKIVRTKEPVNLKFGFITKGDETLAVKTFFSFQSNIGCIKCIFKTEFTDVDESTSTQNNDNKINIKQNTAGITELSDLGHENAKRRKNSDSNFQKPIENKLSTTDSVLLKVSTGTPDASIPKAGDSYIIMEPNATDFRPNEIVKPNVSPNTDSRLNDNLAEIFLRSYKDPRYRTYVLAQLDGKKRGVERMLKKHQSDLKTLEETIENISDSKKLIMWISDFQKCKLINEANNQQTKQIPNVTNNPSGECNLNPNPNTLNQMNSQVQNQSFNTRLNQSMNYQHMNVNYQHQTPADQIRPVNEIYRENDYNIQIMEKIFHDFQSESSF